MVVSINGVIVRGGECDEIVAKDKIRGDICERSARHSIVIANYLKPIYEDVAIVIETAVETSEQRQRAEVKYRPGPNLRLGCGILPARTPNEISV